MPSLAHTPPPPELDDDELRTNFGAFFMSQNRNYGYVPFQQEIIAPALESIVAGTERRLMVFLPFRHGKSDLITVNFVPFYLGHHPEHTVISLSYGKKLAASFGRTVKSHMGTPLYKRLFPDSVLRTDSKAKDNFMTRAGGHYYADGFDGTINGLGANLLIIDDPIKNRQEAMSEATQAFQRELYNSVIRTRLEPDASVVMVTTRWTPGDLPGWRINEDGAIDYITGLEYKDHTMVANTEMAL